MKRALLVLLALPLLLAAKPKDETGAERETLHVVEPGETLAGIAKRAVVPRVLIIEANGLKPPYRVRAGQQLVIPRRRSHTVKRGETGFAIAYQYGIPWRAISTASGIDPADPVKVGQKLVIPTISAAPPPVADPDQPAANADADAKPGFGLSPAVAFVWPAPGKVLRSFKPRGVRGAHDGIDLAGEMGSAVRAAAAGKVVYAGNEPAKFGNLVIVQHGEDWFTAYAKLQKVTVKKGKRVKAGERVGLLGNTGETSRTELHFEVRRDGVPLDPLELLPGRE